MLYVTAVEAARAVGVSDRDVRHWATLGKVRVREASGKRLVNVQDVQDLADDGEKAVDDIASGEYALQAVGHAGATAIGGYALSAQAQRPIETNSAPPAALPPEPETDPGSVDILATLRAHYDQSLSQLMAAHERELVARDAHARSLLVAYNDAVQAREGQVGALQAQLAEARAANAAILALVQDRETIIRLREQEVESLQGRHDDLEEHLLHVRQALTALEVEAEHLRDLLYGPPEPRRRASALICEPEPDDARRGRR